MAGPKPYEPAKRHARYRDLAAAPEHLVAEIVDGDLYLSPRPAFAHSNLAIEVASLVAPARGGPPGNAGWIFFQEPQLRLRPLHAPHRRQPDTVVPDLAGYRRTRLPAVPDVASFALPPDWVCEIASPRTRWLDRTKKLGVYARAGVKHTWLVDPRDRSLEVFRGLTLVAIHTHDARATVPPFGFAVDLSALWKNLREHVPTRASEAPYAYNPYL